METGDLRKVLLNLVCDISDLQLQLLHHKISM